MIIEMSTPEFKELRKTIIALNNPHANKYFNQIFEKNSTGPVKGFVNPLNQKVIIEISETSTLKVEEVFTKNAPDISKLIKGGASITNAPKWLSCIKTVFGELSAIFAKK